jgi:hypothetical protein
MEQRYCESLSYPDIHKTNPTRVKTPTEVVITLKSRASSGVDNCNTGTGMGNS